MGYGAAKNSINSCLKSDGSPTPAPASPTPAPASPTPAPPSPTSAPAPPTSCDVDGCLARCVDEYGGTVTGNGDAYFCAKGCCGMSSGAISDLDKYCKYSPDDLPAECQQSCDGASSTQSKVDDCLYGCGFWGASCDVDGCLARCVDQYGGILTTGLRSVSSRATVRVPRRAKWTTVCTVVSSGLLPVTSMDVLRVAWISMEAV